MEKIMEELRKLIESFFEARPSSTDPYNLTDLAKKRLNDIVARLTLLEINPGLR